MPNTLLSWLQPTPGHSTNAPDKQPATSARSAAPRGADSGQTLTLRPPFGPFHALPAKVQIRRFSELDVQPYKRLNATLLPIPYQDAFYREILEDPVTNNITRLAYWRKADATTTAAATTVPVSDETILVGAIRCRLLLAKPNGEPIDSPILYISTIGTLAPFRNLALATHLLADVTTFAMQEYDVKSIMAHVWEANDEAIGWYQRRGFRVLSREEQYYRRLAPRSAALIMAKDLLPSDVLKEFGQ